MPRDCRAAAAGVLGEVLAGRSLAQALPPALAAVAGRDRGLLRELSYGTLRDSPRLLALLDRLLEKPLRDKDGDVKGLLMCGLYQLEVLRVPDHAAVSATVNAARALGKPWARGLVNAVLRRFQREREILLGCLDEAAAASHPGWLYRELLRQWPDRAPEILEANNSPPPMTLRVNARRCSRDAYLARLESHGISARPGGISPHAVYLDEPREVVDLPGFTDGEVSVQDEAAQLAALLLKPAPGERILDACAAPGGKACHLLELQPGLAELVAMDSDGERLDRVRENLARLRLPATVTSADARCPPGELFSGRFQGILVDAPCSATGVIRRNPDIKLLRRADDIEGFARQQLDILAGVWPLLAEGGRLLYATCSVLSGENSDVVERFLADTPGAEPLPLVAPWGVEAGSGRQLLPAHGGPDGLFYAMLGKSA